MGLFGVGGKNKNRTFIFQEQNPCGMENSLVATFMYYIHKYDDYKYRMFSNLSVPFCQYYVKINNH
jgi:hypothetical protein